MCLWSRHRKWDRRGVLSACNRRVIGSFRRRRRIFRCFFFATDTFCTSRLAGTTGGGCGTDDSSSLIITNTWLYVTYACAKMLLRTDTTGRKRIQLKNTVAPNEYRKTETFTSKRGDETKINNWRKSIETFIWINTILRTDRGRKVICYFRCFSNIFWFFKIIQVLNYVWLVILNDTKW